jgi:hypothetical protein
MGELRPKHRRNNDGGEKITLDVKLEDDMATGKVLKYSRGLNLFSSKAVAMVYVDGQVIRVPVDVRQLEFLQRGYPPGNDVAMGFYDGRWHFIS